MYNLDFNLGGPALKQFTAMIGSLGQIQTGAIVAQKALDAFKLPKQSVDFSKVLPKPMPTIPSVPGVSSVSSVPKADLVQKIKLVLTGQGEAEQAYDTLNKIADKAKVSTTELTNSFVGLRQKGIVIAAADMKDMAFKLQMANRDAQKLPQTLQTLNPILTEAGKPTKTLKDSFGSILTAALDVQRGFEFLKYPLMQLPDRFTSIQSAVVGVRDAMNTGNWSVAAESITAGFTESMGVINDFRTSWGFVKEGFIGAKTVFSETFSVLSEGALKAIGHIRTMGTTLITQTLPNVFAFVGRSVLSFGAYAASLMGATGAQIALNVAMTANPIGVIVVGIAAVGTAVYGLIKYWDDVKKFLGNMASYLWAMNPFSWLINLVKNVFPNFYNGVKEWFGKAFSFIDSTFIQPLKDFFNWFMSMPDKVATVSAETTNYYKNMFGQKDDNPFSQYAFKGFAFENATNLPVTSSVTPKGLGIDKKNKEISGENRQVKNINITIGSIGQGLTVVSNNIQESEQKVKDIIMRLLVDSVNQANYQ